MKNLRFIFSDQLSCAISSLSDTEKEDVIFFCEVMEEVIHVKPHPKKIAFIFAAMRHFAAELKSKHHQICYVKLTDPSNTNTLSGEIKRAVQDFDVRRIILTEPSEYRIRIMVDSWHRLLGIPVEIRTDNRFLCSRQEFKAWATGKKQLRMEYFYRDMRKKYQILMEPNGSPTGGEWNYDKENRTPP